MFLKDLLPYNKRSMDENDHRIASQIKRNRINRNGKTYSSRHKRFFLKMKLDLTCSTKDRQKWKTYCRLIQQ